MSSPLPLSPEWTGAASRLSAAEYVTRVQAASDYVRSSLVSGGVCSSESSAAGSLCVGVVLGSGLSDFTRLLHRPLLLDYADIPFMPRPAVSGHHGQLLVGRLPPPQRAADEDTAGSGLSAGTGTVDPASPLLLCFSGRVHSYEGHLSSSVCFISRLCGALGVRCMLFTNSAGGSGPGMDEGSVMLIVDHIRACSLNAPLDCCADERLGAAAIDCSSSPLVYSTSLRPVARSAASACGVTLHEGVYQWSCGPTYESHAEVRAGMRQNVSAFGMSTVPEVMAAASLGLPTMALSLCTNLAAGLSDEQLTHDAVKAVANLAGPRFTRLVHNIVDGLHSHFAQQAHTANTQSPFERPPATTATLSAAAVVGSSSDTTTAAATVPGDVGVCRLLSLRPLVGWQPSLAELTLGARVLLDSNVGHPPPAVVIQLPASVVATASDHTPLPSSLGGLLLSVRYVPLSDLPSLRQWPHSRSSLQGWLLLGTERHSGTRVALVSCPAPEGLTAAEALYVMQLLSLAGARSFVQLSDGVLAPAGSTSQSAPCSFVSLCDVMDRSMDPLPSLALPALSVSLRAARPVFDASLSECVERCLSSVGCVRGGVCSFGGPSFPSRSELLTAAQAGCVGVGVAGVAPLLIASRLGLLTAGLWRLSVSAAAIRSATTTDSWSDVLGELVASIGAHVCGVASHVIATPAVHRSSAGSLLPSVLPAPATVSRSSAGCVPSAYVCEQESWLAVAAEAERLLSLLQPVSESSQAGRALRAVIFDSTVDQRLSDSFQLLGKAEFSWSPTSHRWAANEQWTIQHGLLHG